MLAAQPSLSRASLYAAAAVGDVGAARELLVVDPSLATMRGGPLQWEPLLYACYSRLDSVVPYDGSGEGPIWRNLTNIVQRRNL